MQIAAGGTDGENLSAGKKMVERLFLNRVDLYGAGPAVSYALNFTIDILPNPAVPDFTKDQFATLWADGTSRFHISKYVTNNAKIYSSIDTAVK